MRIWIGLAALGLGVFVIGYGGSMTQAKRIEQNLQAYADDVVQSSVHHAKVAVSGRDITVSGLANGVKERDRLIAELNQVPGRRVVRDELEVLQDAVPFTTQGAKII